MRTSVLLLTLVACAVVAGARDDHHNRRNDSHNESGTTVEGLFPSNHSIFLENRKSSEFPDDLFTDEQLRHGAALLHFIAALYCFAMIGIICGNYFLPSVDCICLSLNLSQDVAAATFMSLATTAPELFTVIIGTFISESDVGLGAVIGSGMFNILGVATFGGLAAIKPIQLDWWPVLRDSSIYLLALTVLFVVIHDGSINIPGASFMFACYFLYLLIMVFNQRLRKHAKAFVRKIRKKRKTSVKSDYLPVDSSGAPSDKPKNDVAQHKIIPSITVSAEVPPIVFNDDQPGRDKDDLEIGTFEDDTSYKAYFINYDRRSLSRKSIRSERGSFTSKSVSDSERKESFQGPNLELPGGDKGIIVFHDGLKDFREPEKLEEVPVEEEEYTGVDLAHKPDGSVWEVVVWVILWPGSFLLYLTVPDCRVMRWRKFFPLTFLMCVFWIGVTSYIGNWMISVIGDTIGIPESVMGMTFLAAGGCMPEAISTVIMARQGEGGLGFSNSLGGNTINICLCLGLPWLLKCLLDGPIKFDSESLQYNSIALFIGVFILVAVSAHTRFNMNKRMGVICGLCYVVFVVVSALFEMGAIPR